MSLTGAVFIITFSICSIAALFMPFAGIVGYVLHYHTYPENSWWGRGLASSGVRFGLTVSIFLVLGTLRNVPHLQYRQRLTFHERLYLYYLAWMLITRGLTGLQIELDYLDKMLKISVFILILTHVVVTPVLYSYFSWLMVGCGLFLGYEARLVPASYYYEGRLNGGVGGPDFSDSNALAAHMVALLSFAGVQYFRSQWKGKLISLVSAAFILNTVVLTRSRAAFLALLVGGVAALVWIPRGGLRTILPVILAAAIGGSVLIDKTFLDRMGTIKYEESQLDNSAQDRVISWRAAFRMFLDHPIYGVGVGNFGAHMGDYLAGHAGRDPHNTYVKCAAELGIPGFILLSALILNAFSVLNRISRLSGGVTCMPDLAWQSYGLKLALIMYLIEALFGSFNYIEMFTWILLLPTALERVAANSFPTTNEHP
jgi:O-antigen ligase